MQAVTLPSLIEKLVQIQYGPASVTIASATFRKKINNQFIGEDEGNHKSESEELPELRLPQNRARFEDHVKTW